tara:strand:- start:373 stop:492 length:120 start_codon:yes stop_codon:yes gene_type:complete
MNQLSFDTINKKLKSIVFTFIGSLKKEISNTLKKMADSR